MLSKTPAPPSKLPQEIVKGYDVDGYCKLINTSFSKEEKQDILKELESEKVIDRAELLMELYENDMFLTIDEHESRTTFLAALLCLQKNKISINQLATLHLIDSAQKTLYTYFTCLSSHKYVENQEVKEKAIFYNLSNLKDMPSEYNRFIFDEIILPNEKYKISDLPKRMQKPLVQRFFNFTDAEWGAFQREMKTAPLSEKYIHIFKAPRFGCWSELTSIIQQYLKCLQDLDWLRESRTGNIVETIMVVPSFTMFQAAINVKSQTLKRKPVRLVPVYDYLKSKYVSSFKVNNETPVVLYFPEKDTSLQYKNDKGKFRQTVDSYSNQTAFSGFIHDIYHAFREMMMTEKVALARMRLMTIAKGHPKNRIGEKYKYISRILADGELIFNYGLDKDTVFNPEFRSDDAEIFGDLFYTPGVKENLDCSLKLEFILDMKLHCDEWQETFGLGKNDLRRADQVLYDEIEARCINLASQNNDIEKINYILKNSKLETLDEPRYNLLDISVNFYSPDVLGTLLKAGLNTSNQWVNMAPIMRAILGNKLEHLKVWLHYDKNINQFYKTANNRYYEAINDLLDTFGKMLGRDQVLSITPLMAAVLLKDKASEKLLREHGADDSYGIKIDNKDLISVKEYLSFIDCTVLPPEKRTQFLKTYSIFEDKRKSDEMNDDLDLRPRNIV